MSVEHLLVPARYYRRLDEVLAAHGQSLKAITDRMRLPADALDAADCSLRFSQVERLIAHATQISGRSDLGFDVGRMLSLSSHSTVGFALMASATAGQALAFIARYFRLIMPSFTLRFTSRPGREELLFTPTVAMSHQCLAFHLDAIVTASLRVISDLMGGSYPQCRIEFSIPQPRHGHRYAELRDAQVFFQAYHEPGVRLQFVSDFGSYALSMPDSNAVKVAEQRCRALIQHVGTQRRYSDWVEMTLREVGNGGPSLEEMARLLNLSKRTLNRCLEREGTRYSAILKRVQHDLACERLRESALSITEIAYSLGFTDLSNFTRAFRTEAGISPSEFRLKDKPAKRLDKIDKLGKARSGRRVSERVPGTRGRSPTPLL